MKNNKGFTLVELVVVIAMMAIIAGVSSTVISTVSKQELKDFTNNLDAMLCQTKIETMSGMTDPVLEISVRNGEYRATLYQMALQSDGSRVKEPVKSQYLGDDYLKCTYTSEGNVINYTGSGVISFKYDRNTGELINKKITDISVTSKLGTYTIQFVPQTGYHKIVN